MKTQPSEGIWGGTDGVACRLGVRKEEQAEEGRQAERSDFLPDYPSLSLALVCDGNSLKGENNVHLY